MTQADAIRVRWYCGYFVGDSYWHNDTYEPDECGTEFETVESLRNWSENGCTAFCPKCGALLTKNDDEPEMIANAD